MLGWIDGQLPWWITGPGVGLCVVALYGLVNARLGVSGAWLATIASMEGQSSCPRRSRTGAAAASRLAALSPREVEVLRLLARGLFNAEIARQLFVSDATTETHVSSVLAEQRLRDRVQAVIFAYETGLPRSV